MSLGRGWFRLTVGVTLSALGAMLIAGHLARERARDAAQWVEHSTAVELGLRNVRKDVDDAYFGATEGGDPEPNLAGAEAELTGVRALTVDNPGQAARCKQLSAELARARNGIARGDAAPTASFRHKLRAMMEEEARLGSGRQDARIAARDRWETFLRAGVAGTVFVALFAVVVFAALRRRAMREHALLDSILESMGDGVAVLGRDRKLLLVNPAARSLFPGLVEGNGKPEGLHGIGRDGRAMTWAESPLVRALDGESRPAEIIRLPDPAALDGYRWINTTARPVRDQDGALVGSVAVYGDVTAQCAEAQRLASMSVTDDLTGLSNRRGFLLLAEQHVRLAQRTRTPFVLLFADMNGLKKVNDTLGHEAGDAAIRAFARVFHGTLRACDIVARLGGDEFVALVAGASLANVRVIEARLRDELTRENQHGVLDVAISASVGASAFDPASPRTLADLLCEADERMYQNKSGRRASRPALRVVERARSA
ncbi:MAG TPA: diguanylate cyclase [Polyangiaceae bacterium]|jgi:diguanylate cyclase (GGDEF)-like protein